jgi:hypothetical protein
LNISISLCIPISVAIITSIIFYGIGDSANAFFHFSPGTQQFVTYEDTTKGVTISYPVDWYFEDRGPTGITFFIPKQSESDLSNAGVNLRIKETNNTLQRYTENRINGFKNAFPDFKLESSSPYDLNGSPGHKIIFTVKEKEQTIKSMQIWTIINKIAYDITYKNNPSTFDKYTSIIERMANSLRIIENAK